MDTRFSLISGITLHLGLVCLDDPYGGTEVWIDLLVALPRVYVIQYSIHHSSVRTGMGLAVSAVRSEKPRIIAKHRRISFTYTTLYSPWPVGQEYDNARDFCDLFLSRFFQWPAKICSNRSNVFTSTFASISEQVGATVASLQGVLLYPPVPRSKLSDSPK